MDQASLGIDANGQPTTPLKGPRKGNVVSQLRNWRFWLYLASVFPSALISRILLCLYIASFAIFPSGVVVYVAAGVHTVLLVIGGRFFVKNMIRCRAQRREGLEVEFKYVQNALGVASILAMTSPITALGILNTVPHLSSSRWIEMAKWMFFR